MPFLSPTLVAGDFLGFLADFDPLVRLNIGPADTTNLSSQPITGRSTFGGEDTSPSVESISSPSDLPTVPIRELPMYTEPRVIDETVRHRYDSTRRDPPYTWLAFGGGPRNCIGGAFAQIESKIVLARILQRFDLQLLPGRVHPHMGATLEPRPGVLMRVTSR